MKRLALALTLLATPAAAAISPCDVGGASIPNRVAAIENAILQGEFDELREPLANLPGASLDSVVAWLGGQGYAFETCEAVFYETLSPAILRRGVLFMGPEAGQRIAVYMDVIEINGQYDVVVFNLTRSLEDFMDLVR